MERVEKDENEEMVTMAMAGERTKIVGRWICILPEWYDDGIYDFVWPGFKCWFHWILIIRTALHPFYGWRCVASALMTMRFAIFISCRNPFMGSLHHAIVICIGYKRIVLCFCQARRRLSSTNSLLAVVLPTLHTFYLIIQITYNYSDGRTSSAKRCSYVSDIS